MNIKIREYQGWSINNTRHMIDFCNYLDGTIVLVSDKEINEVELLGLEKIIRDDALIWEGLDLSINIFEGRYNKESDSILIYDYHAPFYRIAEVSKRNIDGKLDNAKDIICIVYNCEKRYNKSKWWRFKNRRKCEINNYINKEYDM